MTDEEIASDSAAFWERRREFDPDPITDDDIAARASGGGRHLVLLASVDDAAVTTAMNPLLARLDDCACFAATPTRNLHVTVKVIGDVCEDPEAGVLTPAELESVVDGIGTTLEGRGRFELSIPRLNVFPDVVYAEVDDGGRFRRLNEAVCTVEGVGAWPRDGEGFLPHLSLGHVTAREGYDRLLDAVESERKLSVPTVTVRELRLVALDFAEGRFPPYETVATYALGR